MPEQRVIKRIYKYIKHSYFQSSAPANLYLLTFAVLSENLITPLEASYSSQAIFLLFGLKK